MYSLYELSGTAPCWVRVPLAGEEGIAYRPQIGAPEDAAALPSDLPVGESRERFLERCLVTKQPLDAVPDRDRRA